MSRLFRQGWVLMALVLAGCGTYATPVWQATITPTAVAIADASGSQSVVQTIAPTETPIPTTTPEPTAIPTEESTPTQEPTTAQVASPIDRLVAISDVENGETLFNMQQPSIGFACSTCHHVDQETQLIGPGLLNIKDRAATRVDGQSAAEYMNNSIHNPNDFIVEGFPEGVMPQNWSDVYSDSDIFDIIAYLMTLEGEAVVIESTGGADKTASNFVPSDEVKTSLPDTANAEIGAVLFQTFQLDAGFACSTCHNSDSENRLIGPGLLNVGSRADTRVDGQPAIDYLYTSITNPGAFIVPDFPDRLMPVNWAEIYTEDEIYDIIAYLLTLE